MGKHRFFGLVLVLVMLLSSSKIVAVSGKFGYVEPLSTDALSEEGLDELFARKQRLSQAVYPWQELEDQDNHYIWQPETVMYRDIETGHEVWRMSNTPNLNNYYHNDIGVTPWSADGKRMAFTSFGRLTDAYEGEEGWYMWMVVDTNGQCLRPTVGSPRRIGGGYFHWSPQIPDTFYEIGETHLFPWGERPNPSTLYKAVVSDTAIVSTPMFTFTFGGGNIDKYISGDGRKIIVRRWMGDGVPRQLYPATVYPESGAQVDDPNGFSEDRDFGPYGNTDNPIVRYHDAYYAGDGSWYFGMPSESATWWRIKVAGSAPDGGGLYTGDLVPPADEPPYDFGEVWPENHGEVGPGHISSPWVQDDPYTPDKTGYWSHFVPDRWGKYALFSAVSDGLPNGYGPGVWNIQDHQYTVPSFGGGAQHHDWHGFTDWTVSSRGSGGEGHYLNDRLYIQKYDQDGTQEVVCRTHTLYNQDGIYGGAGSQYFALSRPAQSPDGTKVAFHTTFLNPDDYHADVYWVVAYYPYPPTDLEASDGGGGVVSVSWLPPKYTERGWPYANPDPTKDTQGWPLLDGGSDEIGEPLYAREIKRYHVWRSPSGTGEWQEVGAVDAEYSATYAEDAEMFMLHPTIASGAKVSETNKISFTDNPGDGTYHYAVTSEEHSGLESDELSEVLRVMISGGSVTSQAVVQPRGQRDYWTTSPPAPFGFSYGAQPAPGHYELHWSEPNDDKIRYYNIYYSTAGNPPPTQAYRIASVPVGTSTYLDWLADPSAPAYYTITSVDRQGNESSGSTSGLVLHGTPADQAIHLDWTVNVTLPVTGTWRIDYYTQTLASTIVATDALTSTARAYTLTGLENFHWYTVTLNAMVDATAILSDTVRVMPTNIFVYLPLVLR